MPPTPRKVSSINLIEIAQVTKNYWIPGSFFSSKKTKLQALKEISFSIEQGEFVGFIGPNGAGKSTTLKILTGILTPDAGRVSVFGMIPWKDRIKLAYRIGVVFGQKTQLWWDLPVLDSFDLLQKMYRIPLAVYKQNKEEMIELLKLEPFLPTPVRNLSLGQRMRADMGASLLHSPEMLFLDEPTIGLDAPTKVSFRNFLRTINQEKKVTILLTTHDTRDIEELCPRILFINHGSLLRDGSLKDFREELQKEAQDQIESVEDLFVRLYEDPEK